MVRWQISTHKPASSLPSSGLRVTLPEPSVYPNLAFDGATADRAGAALATWPVFRPGGNLHFGIPPSCKGCRYSGRPRITRFIPLEDWTDPTDSSVAAFAWVLGACRQTQCGHSPQAIWRARAEVPRRNPPQGHLMLHHLHKPVEAPEAFHLGAAVHRGLVERGPP